MNISQFLTKLKTLVYSKNEVDTKLSAVVHTSGAEDISGNKNFIDNLTRSGKNVEAIEEQSEGYVRYSSGIQICWGTGIFPDTVTTITYPRPFVRNNEMSVQVNSYEAQQVKTANWFAESFVLLKTGENAWVSWLAIGRWKD